LEGVLPTILVADENQWRAYLIDFLVEKQGDLRKKVARFKKRMVDCICTMVCQIGVGCGLNKHREKSSSESVTFSRGSFL
jgi:hypothetical protein